MLHHHLTGSLAPGTARTEHPPSPHSAAAQEDQGPSKRRVLAARQASSASGQRPFNSAESAYELAGRRYLQARGLLSAGGEALLLAWVSNCQEDP